MPKIIKLAHIKDEDMPDPKALSAYIKVLKLYLLENNVSSKYEKLIRNLPTPRVVRTEYSWEECKLIFETVNYLWKKILNKDITKEQLIQRSKQKLLGNYWVFRNGVMIQGVNHFTMIKDNSMMISLMLNLNGFTLQYYMSTNPDKLIRYILQNGGARMFVDTNNQAFFQMSESTYAKWGRAKVKKYDFKKKVVKIIDFKTPYDGWKSGIPIIL